MCHTGVAPDAAPTTATVRPVEELHELHPFRMFSRAQDSPTPPGEYATFHNPLYETN